MKNDNTVRAHEQSPYGDLTPHYDWVKSLVVAARSIPVRERDELRLQTLAHSHAGPDCVTARQRTAAGALLSAIQAKCYDFPKSGLYVDTRASREALGLDMERVHPEHFRILLWTPTLNLWCTAIEDLSWGPRDLSAWAVLAGVLVTLVPEPVSASWDPEHPPYYMRTLDSFNDAIITSARPSTDGRGWYASLDVGPDRQVSDPDFCRYAGTKDDAVALCAAAIRANARGVGQHAPRGVFSAYDLKFRLMKHWAEKERAHPSA